MKLSIIHFSDIHIKNKDDSIFSKIDKLKCACASKLPTNGHVCIAISGDIAFSGKLEQYNLAKYMLDDLSVYLKNQKNSEISYAFVPGNHDCDFSKDTPTRNIIISSDKPSDLDEECYNLATSSVQRNYNDFSLQYGVQSDKLMNCLELKVNDNNILFVLVNTAWMSRLKENPGQIIIPSQFIKSFDANKYKVVFYMFHHPINWFNPDYKNDFEENVREHADMVLIGHEHHRDGYEKVGNNFSIYCRHAKELQDSNSPDSGFSILNFDESFQNYEIVEFKWDQTRYIPFLSQNNQYHKNSFTFQTVYQPNAFTITSMNDMGMVVNHFHKENIILPDLFVWPYLNKIDYYNESVLPQRIENNAYDELTNNLFNIVIGANSYGKTAMAKMIFLMKENKDECCVFLRGEWFNTANEKNVQQIIEKKYCEQYSEENLIEFCQLPKEKRCVIFDNFDAIKAIKNRRNDILEYISSYFGQVIIFVSSNIELATIFSSKRKTGQIDYNCYEILPLGNRKRKELISKWYSLADDILDEGEIENKIDSAQKYINVFLGASSSIIPATPFVIIATLQNGDAIKPTYDQSKYCFLYEALITGSLSKVLSGNNSYGNHSTIVEVLSQLSFYMLCERRKSFTLDKFKEIIQEMNKKFLMEISSEILLTNIEKARLIREINDDSKTYKFSYPYIFYYFCGHYLAFHRELPEVHKKIEYMSAHLYNETYGNIIIFMCHFANDIEVINEVLLNAYCTLDEYAPFDFNKTNPIFSDIQDIIESIVPKTIASNDEVLKNKEQALTNMDNAGINDGTVSQESETFDDEISDEEKTLSHLMSAFKIMEVLGQILQNYPLAIEAKKKIEIITEIHKLGMRAVQATASLMGCITEDLIEFEYNKFKEKNENISKDEVALKTRNTINLIMAGMAGAMIHHIAYNLNSMDLLPAAQKSFTEDSSISAKLIFTDLKLNCLKTPDFIEIKNLKKSFDEAKENFASEILTSLVAIYLRYNKCTPRLKSQFCSLFGFVESKRLLVASSSN